MNAHVGLESVLGTKWMEFQAGVLCGDTGPDTRCSKEGFAGHIDVETA